MTTKKADAVVVIPSGIHMKLHLAKQHIGAVTKSSINPHFKKSYADINAILEVVEPVLLKYNLLLLQPIKDNIVVTQVIDVENSETIESYMTLPAITDPQKMIAAITYYRRATLQSLLSLQAVDDDGTSTAKAKIKPVLSPENFAKGMLAINEGRYTANEMREAYTLTAEQEAQL